MDSPIWGMMMSVGMISFHKAQGPKKGLGANDHYNGLPEFDWKDGM
jgi:hypothetical protein